MKKVKEVMLIDEDDLSNYITARMIEHAGLSDSITGYQSASKALAFLEENSLKDNGLYPNVILLDLSFLGMSGWEFLDEYQKLSRDYTDKIDLFILSTSILERDRAQARNYNRVKGFFHKPLTMPIIDEIVRITDKRDRKFAFFNFLYQIFV